MTQDTDGKIALDHPQSPESAAGALLRSEHERCLNAIAEVRCNGAWPGEAAINAAFYNIGRSPYLREFTGNLPATEMTARALVPTEPTKEMTFAGGAAAYRRNDIWDLRLANEIYAAMIAAAPSAPAQVIEPTETVRDVANLESSEAKHGN